MGRFYESLKIGGKGEKSGRSEKRPKRGRK
jgi:hypothetical protein